MPDLKLPSCTERAWTGCRAAALMVGIGMLSAPAIAQRPEPPPFYAIRDAQVVTAPGHVLERATVLIADGLIEAVGADLEIPADAWVIDGTGLVVYPGLIDAMTTLGQAPPESGPPSAGPERSGRDQPTIRGPEDRPQTTPWKSAADLLIDDDGRIESWREAGFTAAVTVPEGGIFPGQATLIHLGESEKDERVIATPVAQRIVLAGRSRTFPGSLMGRISYIQQVLSDAQYSAQVRKLYERSPVGRERPLYDRAIDPIREAVEVGVPFFLPADHGHEIDRMLAIAERWQLRPILVGGQAAYARAAMLGTSNAAVVVNLDWPEADKNEDPDADTPLPTLYHHRMAPSTPAALLEAGVEIAFTSGELSGPSMLFEKLRTAIDAGLSVDDALEALTLGAARILGVEDQLGSIAAGKIANLVLASAEPWAEDVEIKAVFVDGKKYESRPDDEESEPPSVNVSGSWALELTTPGGVRQLTAELNMKDDGKVSGEITSERGTRAIKDGKVADDMLTFKTQRTMGPRTVEAKYTLTVTGETVDGSLSVGPRSMDLTGERTAAAASKEDEGETPAVSNEDFEHAMSLYRGPVRRIGSFAITNARVYTVSDPTLDSTLTNATVVVRDGKIAALGQDIEVPAGLEVIDAAGGSLIPGIIDAHSHIAVDGAVNESSLAVTSMVTIQDVIAPADIAIYRALAGGVTTINVLHGSSNPIGGGNAVLKLRWGSDADGLRFAGAPAGIKFALGENPKRSRGNPPPGVARRYPATRMGVMDVIRQAFTEAREYARVRQQAEQGPKGTLPPRPDFKLDRLAEILAGERLVHAHCYRADEILQLLQLADEFGFRISTLQHVLEGYKVADEIAAHGAGASTFSDWWGYKVEAYDAIPHNAALMTERGVLVSINSDSGEEMRHLNQEAAKAIKWGGLDENAALRLVTLNPAIQLGIDDRVGSIEVGKDADLTLYDGHPLSVYSIVQKTFIDGDLYFELEADRQRQTAIDDLKAKLHPSEDTDEKESDGEDNSEPQTETMDAEPPPPDANLAQSEARS